MEPSDATECLYHKGECRSSLSNLLFGLNSIFNHRSDFRRNPYKIFGIRYSQYFKAEADYGAFHIFDRRNSLAWHIGLGIGIPYGNSTILPF